MTTTSRRAVRVWAGATAWLAAMAVCAGPALGQDDASSSPSLSDLAAQASALQSQVSAGADGSKSLAAQVAQQYATDSAAGKVNWDEWIPLVTPVGRYLPADTQAAMTASLLQSAQPGIAQASYAKLKAACDCLSSLGNDGSGAALARQWVGGSDAYKQLPTSSLLALAIVLPRSDSDGGAGQRVGELVRNICF